MAKLTHAEKHLLAHPPTPKTWACARKRKNEESGEVWICPAVMPGTHRTCWLCGKPKPAKPKLLWPAYLAACQKAGVTPKGAE